MKKLLLLFIIMSLSLQALGPKKFVKEGWNYCRDRESHPGRQCCYSISSKPLEIPALGAVNSQNIEGKEIVGFGHNCWTTCECNTILPEIKCSKNNDCGKLGPYFKCVSGKCKFPCLRVDDCAIKFGKDYICSKKFCEIKPKTKEIK